MAIKTPEVVILRLLARVLDFFREMLYYAYVANICEADPPVSELVLFKNPFWTHVQRLDGRECLPTYLPCSTDGALVQILGV